MAAKCIENIFNTVQIQTLLYFIQPWAAVPGLVRVVAQAAATQGSCLHGDKHKGIPKHCILNLARQHPPSMCSPCLVLFTPMLRMLFNICLCVPAVGKSVGEPPGWFVDHGSLFVLIIAGVVGAVTLVGAVVATMLYCRRAKAEPRPSIV